MASMEAFAQPLSSFNFAEIEIRGNASLSDEEVASLCDITSTRNYNSSDLGNLVQCLGQTDRFSEVSLETEGRNLVVNVIEAPEFTGLLDISVSADTDLGVGARLYIEDRDLFDMGVVGFAEMEASREEKTVIVGLANPGFMETASTLGLSLRYSEVAYDDAAYQVRRLAVSPYLQYPTSPNVSLTLSAGAQIDELYNIDATASPILLGEATRRELIFLRGTFSATIQPDADLRTQIGIDASQTFTWMDAEPHSSITTARLRARTELIPERLSFGLEIGGSHIESLGEESSLIIDRQFLGGRNLRGFAHRGIGPVDGEQFLGGNSSAYILVETDSPIADVQGVGLSGGVFANAGAVWNLDNTSGFIDPVDDNAQLRSAVGVALTARFGELPLTAYYARPLDKLDTDIVQEFGLAISSKF